MRTNFHRRDKIVLSILMGVSLCASMTCIPKFTALEDYKNSADFTWREASFTMWTSLELYIIIISICIPSLKSFFEKSLRRYGLLNTNQSKGLEGSSTGMSLSTVRKSGQNDGTVNIPLNCHGNDGPASRDATICTEATLMAESPTDHTSHHDEEAAQSAEQRHQSS